MHGKNADGIERRALDSALVVTIKGSFPGPDGEGFGGSNSFSTTIIADEPVHSIEDVHRLVGALGVMLIQNGWSAICDAETLVRGHAGGGLLIDAETGEVRIIAAKTAKTDPPKKT